MWFVVGQFVIMAALFTISMYLIKPPTLDAVPGLRVKKIQRCKEFQK